MKQNEHLVLGKINTLKISRDSDYGFFLIALDEKEVLLPKSYKTNEMKIGDLIEVFLYTDSEDRLVATTQKPLAMLDELAYMQVVDSTKFGVFLSWGLPKDLLVPRKHQKETLKIGDKAFFRVIYDEKTHRLIGTQKLGDIFLRHPKYLKKYQKVKIVPMQKTPLGFRCLVEDRFEGLIYTNEIFQNIAIGETLMAYVKNIRADGLIDLTLNSKNNSSLEDKVISFLNIHNGIMPYNYKSDATLIYEVFGMSKKSFKATLTKLCDRGLIEIKENGVVLSPKNKDKDAKKV